MMQLLVLLNLVIFMTVHVKAGVKDCPELYWRYSKFHSYCKYPNPQCPKILKSSVTSKDIDEILNEHNNLRSSVATGKRNLPTASNMLQMVWDNELAAVAQSHANQCVYEHDCSECRRVGNFAVGQNIATSMVWNTPNVPEVDWKTPIFDWFNEIKFFKENAIDPFRLPPPPPEETYLHFTQIAWAETWRIGCGYVMMLEGSIYRILYVCNYGPAGNVDPGSLYKKGQMCSACPSNSCCHESCGTTPHYPGLCQITDNKAPVYKRKGNYFFFCNFQNQSDCALRTITGPNKWIINTTLSGNFIGIILKAGEESAITFGTKIKPKDSSFCFVIKYRKGPNYAGEETANEAIETFTIVGNNYEVKEKLANFDGDRHTFNSFQMNLGWNMETEVTLSFSVPPGKPDQFFEIKELYAYDGRCKDWRKE